MDSNKPLLISIGRQVGSQGYYIGKALAEDLKLNLYDKELITQAARESSIAPQFFEKVDEKPGRGLSNALSISNYIGGSFYSQAVPLLSSENLFNIQAEVIRRLASEKSCVFIGRCADYVLRDFPRLLTVFVCAPEKVRIQTLCERLKITYSQARSMLQKKDKQRSAYYNFFTDKIWGSASSYHLCIDSHALGMEHCLKLIKEAVSYL